jgi:hypothetical protein
MKRNPVLAAVAGVLLLWSATALAQANSTLTLQGLDGNPLTVTVEQLQHLPQQSATITHPHTKATERYEGVPLVDLLAKVNAPPGDKLRGDEMRDYVEVAGRDEYRAVFALAELDPAFQDNHVLVAITMDGKPLDDKLGPARVVAPQDERPARSVRMVTTITVRRAP